MNVLGHHLLANKTLRPRQKLLKICNFSIGIVYFILSMNTQFKRENKSIKNGKNPLNPDKEEFLI